MSYLGVFMLLSLLILIHEAGHLLAAKRVGIPVAGFSVGLGPKIWSGRRRKPSKSSGPGMNARARNSAG